MNKKFWLLIPFFWFLACNTEPEAQLDANWSVIELDSLINQVVFEATAPDTLWWKLEWVNPDILIDYGQAVYDVKVRINYTKGFRFILDFTVWNKTDKVVVTFMETGNET